MHSSYDPRLVALSVAIATLASSVVLDLVARAHVAGGRARRVWLTGGAMAMGGGIWSMHFVGMLAFRLHHGPAWDDGAMLVPLAYHVPLVVLSVLVAITASAIALGAAVRPRLHAGALGAASL